MTKFNPDNKKVLTYSESLDPAMNITDQEDADQYLAAYAEWLQKKLDIDPDPRGLSGLDIAKINLGYWAGYYSEDIALRVNELFNSPHPIFGNKIPTAEEAFNMGKNRANEKA